MVLFLICSFLVITVVILLTLAFMLVKILFTSLIIWRGIPVNMDFLDKLTNVINDMTAYIPIVGYIMYPFVMLIAAFSNFNINLSSVDVTCKGSQAPLQILINIVICMCVVIFIESGIDVILRVPFNNTNKVFMNAVLTYNLNLSSWAKYTALFFSFVSICFVAASPFVKILQLLMGLVTVSEFFVDYGLLHESSPACNIHLFTPVYLTSIHLSFNV